MPVQDDYRVPDSAQALPLSDDPADKFFLLFLSSVDPATNEPWCSDVRAALPLLNSIFAQDTSPNVRYVYVGQRPEYKSPTNFYRTNWDINFVPTLAAYQRIDGKVKEIGRLVEGELLDEKRVYSLINIA